MPEEKEYNNQWTNILIFQKNEQGSLQTVNITMNY